MAETAEQQRLQADVEQLRRDVDLIGGEMNACLADVERRFDGVRTDFEVALLQQVTKILRRQERLEALFASYVGRTLDGELRELRKVSSTPAG